MAVPSAAVVTSSTKSSFAALLSPHIAELLAETNFVATCATEFSRRGFVHIPGFLAPSVVKELNQEALSLLSTPQTSFYSSAQHNVYQEEDDDSYTSHHPRNEKMTSSKWISDFARINQDSPTKRLYRCSEMLNLVKKVVDVPKLYLSSCPFNAAYYNGYGQGDGLGWHFDRSSFGVNLILSAPLRGGEFQFHKNTRSEEDPWSYPTVSQVISGDEKAEEVHEIGPGSLVFFSGHNSLHRVTRVVGDVPRINIILTYEEEESRMANESSLKTFFGRTPEEQRNMICDGDNGPATEQNFPCGGRVKAQDQVSLWVGGLPFKTSDDELLSFMSRTVADTAGAEIYGAYHARSKKGRPRGFGYVECNQIAHDFLTINGPDTSFTIKGRWLRICPAAVKEPSKSLYISNLSWETTASKLYSVFDGCTHVKMGFNKKSNLDKGFAFVDFASVEDATAAKDKLTGVALSGNMLRIDWNQRAISYREGGICPACGYDCPPGRTKCFQCGEHI